MRLASNKKSKKIKVFDAVMIVCIAANLLLIALVLIFQKNLAPVVPLYYGLPLSEEQLAPRNLLIIPSLIALVVIAFNFLLTKTVIKDSFLHKVLVSIMVVTTLLSTITILKIIFLIGSFS